MNELWSHDTFSNLFAYSPLQAFEYRERVLGVKMSKEDALANNIPYSEEEVKTPTSIPLPQDLPTEPTEPTTTEEVVEKVEEIIEEAVDEVEEINLTPTKEVTDKVDATEEVEVTREMVVEKLKTAQVKFFAGAKTEKLIELAISNNLL